MFTQSQIETMFPDQLRNAVSNLQMETCLLGRKHAELLKANLELKNDLDELRSTFDIRWNADMRAIKQWQSEHPGNDLVWPDHADMVVWLLGKLSALNVEASRRKL